MIKIKNVNKYFGDLQVLKDINIQIEDGEVFGLVGSSGVGKSTLLNCLIGLEKYQEGSICIDGVEVEKLSEKELRNFRRGVGMIFQNFSLVGRKTVYQNIALPMECWHVPKEEIRERVIELARLVGIEDKLSERPSALSGGQKQRVAIARALTMNPRYILCDECTSALDPKTTTSILRLLERIRREMGITIIVVTHEMAVVQQICRRMAILEKGRVSMIGDTQDMFLQRPPALMKLLGEENDIEEQEETADRARITFNAPAEGNGQKILWELGQKLQRQYLLEDMQSFDFPDGRCLEITISIDREDRETCRQCLSEYGIKYRSISEE